MFQLGRLCLSVSLLLSDPLDLLAQRVDENLVDFDLLHHKKSAKIEEGSRLDFGELPMDRLTAAATPPASMVKENEVPRSTNIRLKGLVLVDRQEHMFHEEALQQIEGVSISGLSLPGPKMQLDQLLKPYFDENLSTDLIQKIRKTIHTFYEENYTPFVLIFVPPQVISYGVLQVIIVEGKAGKIDVKGNQWFSEQRIKRYVRTKSGDTIDLYSLERDLDLMNRNPFRRVNMVYAPGDDFGTTNLTFSVEDRRPNRFYVGADNTGIETMGRQRAYTGVTFGNLFGKDLLFTYQYTTSYDFNRFQGHTLQYMAPLPWRHLMNIYGGISFVNPDLPFPSMKHRGRSSQASFRYMIPLKTHPRSTQDLAFGFDYKNTNNTVTFSELVTNFGDSVNLTQFVLEYRIHREGMSNRFDLDLQAFYSPGQIIANQSDSDYETLRNDAKNQWVYGRGSLRYMQRLPKEIQMTLWLQGQYTSADLLPSEQFGIGGYATVRGYDERQLNMDGAFLASLEFRSPMIPIIAMIRRMRVKDSLQFLAFIDYGWGKNRTPMEGEPSAAYLWGAGPGVRYTLDPNIAIRFDWGIKLHNKAVYTGGESQVHFAATVSY